MSTNERRLALQKNQQLAWSQLDESKFINALGTHTSAPTTCLITIETLLNRYRRALCRRLSTGCAAGFSIQDSIKTVDRRLAEVREARERLSQHEAEAP